MAASRRRPSGSKSGNPWAKLIARSGPCRARLRRVISRMTDSVKLSAFSERPIEDLVSGISTLQVQLGARARVAARGPFQAPLPPAADRARPPRLGEEVEHVGAAEEADHLAAPYDRYAADPFADEQPRRLVDPGLLGDGDDARAHDVARDLSLLG